MGARNGAPLLRPQNGRTTSLIGSTATIGTFTQTRRLNQQG